MVKLLLLLSRCIADRENSTVWSEFLGRIAPKIRQFIRGTLRQSLASSTVWAREAIAGGIQENDLFQATIVRLVEDDCAVLRRFSGATEGELLAYLAVITRSVVRDALRHECAKKRPLRTALAGRARPPEVSAGAAQAAGTLAGVEREVLRREVSEISFQTLEKMTGAFSERNRLIFQLHFFHDLSFDQIARCRGINLSKAGVEKVLNQIKNRVRRVASAGMPGATIQ